MIEFIRNIPRHSALGRKLLGEAAEWSADTYRLADAVDLLAIANWQRTGEKRNQPKPIKRPGVETDEDSEWG